jgi:hypothetical protein
VTRPECLEYVASPRRRTSRLLLLLLPLVGHALPVTAQDPAGNEGTPWLVEMSHYGRWPVLAGAGALIGMAAVRSHDARAAQGALEDFCAIDSAQCALVEDSETGGQRYADPAAEALYQEYARLSRQAQGYLIGGQVSLLAAGGMFLIDLLHRDRDFGNIPYTPLELYTTLNKLGLALHF